MRIWLASSFLACAFFANSFLILSAYAEDSKSCDDRVLLLKKKRESVVSQGGLWTLFEKSAELKNHSIKAIQLDSKISEVVEILTYLCETQNGVPLNDLAVYLNQNLKIKSEAQFREELDMLGRSQGDIEIWLAYYKIALKNQKRILDLEQIKNSIHQAEPLLDKYVQISTELNKGHTQNPLLPETVGLTRKIIQFQSSDSYMSQAIQETAKVPYWDIDENYGGS